MKNPLLIGLLLCTLQVATAQVAEKILLGVGGGLNYGGFGAQAAYQHTAVWSAFAGIGYNLNQVGYNLGIQVNAPSEKRVEWYGMAMYGYNAVLKVEGYEGTSTNTYYGPSIGTGVLFKQKRHHGLWNVGVILPFRATSFKNAIDDLKLAGYTVDDPLPVAFCVGYHFRIKN